MKLKKQISHVCRNSNLAIVFITAAVLLGMQSACVTVNVNFPEGTVQKATDDYVKDIYRAKNKNEKPEQTNKDSGWFNYIIPVVYAEDAIQFQMNTAKAIGIQAKLRGRVSEIIQFKKQGFIGEARSGLLAIRNDEKIKPLMFKKIKKLVDDENTDRQELYQEILQANKMDSDKLPFIAGSFYRSFKAESPSGTPVEEGPSVWELKR